MFTLRLYATRFDIHGYIFPHMLFMFSDALWLWFFSNFSYIKQTLPSCFPGKVILKKYNMQTFFYGNLDLLLFLSMNKNTSGRFFL